MHVDFVFQHVNDVQWTSSVIFFKKNHHHRGVVSKARH